MGFFKSQEEKDRERWVRLRNELLEFDYFLFCDEAWNSFFDLERLHEIEIEINNRNTISAIKELSTAFEGYEFRDDGILKYIYTITQTTLYSIWTNQTHRFHTLFRTAIIQTLNACWIDSKYNNEKNYKIAFNIAIKNLTNSFHSSVDYVRHKEFIEKFCSLEKKAIKKLRLLEELDNTEFVNATVKQNEEYSSKEKYRLISIAIKEKDMIEFDYIDNYKNLTKRTIKPFLMREYNDANLVEGFCFLRNTERTFNINRISKILYKKSSL